LEESDGIPLDEPNRPLVAPSMSDSAFCV